jgi:prevent-host-death family protein
MIENRYREGLVISVTELKQNLGKYMDIIEEQNEVVITKNGSKVARLTPYVTDIEQYFTLREKALDYKYGGKKVSYQEFMAISEKSTLRMEYLNGEIFLLTAPTVGHQEISARLHLALSRFFQGSACRVYYAPFDIQCFKKDFKEPDVLQPDLLVACDIPGNVTEKGRYMGIPALVIEILSPSTNKRDMIDKLNSYCLSGVQEYWIVDQAHKNILIYGFKDCSVENYAVCGPGNQAASFTFAGLAPEVDALFSDLP